VGVVVGTEGAVVGGERVEPTPAPPEFGDVVEGEVVEGEVVEGEVVEGAPLTEAVGPAADLTWLGVSWKARPIKTAVTAVAPAATAREIVWTR
jgi:hypothetical protein